MGFIPANFQLTMPFHSRLTGTGQTDGQTDNGHQMHYAPSSMRAEAQ